MPDQDRNNTNQNPSTGSDSPPLDPASGVQPGTAVSPPSTTPKVNPASPSVSDSPIPQATENVAVPPPPITTPSIPADDSQGGTQTVQPPTQEDQVPEENKVPDPSTNIPPVVTTGEDQGGSSKKSKKKKVTAVLIALTTMVLAGVAIFTSLKLYQQKDVAVVPTVPESEPRAEICDVDVMLAIDVSGSMRYGKIEMAKRAAIDFVDKMSEVTKQGPVRIGLVSFGCMRDNNYATLNHGLTDNYASLKNEIRKLVPKTGCKGGTCIECALRKANNELVSKKVEGKDQHVILLSDGYGSRDWNGNKVLVGQARQKSTAVADEGRTQGITYFTIGYGGGGKYDKPTLIEVAGDESRFSFRPNPDDWSQAFIDLIQRICTASPYECQSWTDVHINSCDSFDKFNSNDAACSTTNQEVTINMSINEATEMRFINVEDTSTTCVNVSDDEAGWSTKETYSATKTWTLLDGPGDKKVCGQFYKDGGETAKCGGMISISSETPPECDPVKAYEIVEDVWTGLDSDDLSNLEADDEVYFTVRGIFDNPETDFTAAKFMINANGTWFDSTDTKPGSPGEFYYKYIIPSGVYDFVIEAAVLYKDDTWI